MERLATDPLLRSEQADSFATNGFLTFEQLVSPCELRELKKTIGELFEKRAGEKEGAHLDLVAPGKPGTIQTSPQITNPVNYAPRLHQAQFFQNALAIAKQLLGGTSLSSKLPRMALPLPGIRMKRLVTPISSTPS